MPAVWTSPKTWATGELVTAALLNTHLRDNLEFLKAPPTTVYVLNESSDYTTTSTSFVNVDNTKLALALTTNGGDVLISFHGMLLSSSNGRVISLDVEVDGVRLGGDDGLIAAHWVVRRPRSRPVQFRSPYWRAASLPEITPSNCSGS